MKIMKRNRDASVEQVGTVEWGDGKAVLNVPENYQIFLSKLEFEGEIYTPTDPEYMIILPLALRGDYLWATET